MELFSCGKESSSAGIKVAITNRWTFESNRFSAVDFRQAQEALRVFVAISKEMVFSTLLGMLLDFPFDEMSNELAWNFSGSSMNGWLVWHKNPLSM